MFTSFMGPVSTNPVGMRLPSPRNISNTFCKQSQDIFDPRGLNEMATYFGQFIDHTIVATPENHNGPLLIIVQANDHLFSKVPNGKLGFFRSQRVRVKERDNQEGPQSSLSSVLDLVSVYGPNEMRSRALRTFSDGRKKTSGTDLS